MRRAVLALCLCALFGSVGAAAQWLNYQTPGVPRTRDGKPKLDAPAPRAADGHPDLSGVWMHDLTPLAELRRLFGTYIDEEIKNQLPGMEFTNVHKYAIDILADFPPDNSPARPEIKRFEFPPCYPSSAPVGFPLPGLFSELVKIVQAPRLTMVLYELGGNFRQIYTDGRTRLAEINLPAYLGYSVGRWEGDTFTAETTGFNDKMPLDMFGHPHSDQLRIVERFRRGDFGHLDVGMTFDDPKMYTRPFTISIAYHLLADDDIFEMFPENEKDCAHIGTQK